MEKEVINTLGKANKGFRYERVNHKNPFDANDINKEKVFISRWQKENKKRPAINFGQGILQDLFIENNEQFNAPKMILKIKPVHRYIVATVIQWLGTNCGFAFLIECLNECGYTLKRIERGDN